MRAPHTKTRVTKKPAKKRTAEASDLPNDEELDDLELEVEHDSLGSFFIHLIANDYYQDDAEASRAGDAEVIVLSSDLDHVPVPKIRRAVRKVKFSRPLAYLDPHFILKTHKHEACRTTRHSGQVVTSSGLPNSPVRKRRQEVAYTPDTLTLRRVTSDILLIRLTQIIRELPIHHPVSRQRHNFLL